MKGLMKAFVNDGIIFVGSESGAHVKGIKQLRSFFEELFNGPIAYGFRWENVYVDSVGDFAWAFADCHIQTISAAGHHEHPYRVTAIFQRIENTWQWLHYHGSEPLG